MEWLHFNRESLGYCWYGNVSTHGYVIGALYSWAAATRAFDYDTAAVYRYYTRVYSGHSVRWVKDE